MHFPLPCWAKSTWKTRNVSCNKVFIFKRNDAVQNTWLKLLPHLPYLPDLAPIGFYLFFKTEEIHETWLNANSLRTKTFCTTNGWLEEQDQKFFYSRIQLLPITAAEVLVFQKPCKMSFQWPLNSSNSEYHECFYCKPFDWDFCTARWVSHASSHRSLGNTRVSCLYLLVHLFRTQDLFMSSLALSVSHQIFFVHAIRSV